MKDMRINKYKIKVPTTKTTRQYEIKAKDDKTIQVIEIDLEGLDRLGMKICASNLLKILIENTEVLEDFKENSVFINANDLTYLVDKNNIIDDELRETFIDFIIKMIFSEHVDEVYEFLKTQYESEIYEKRREENLEKLRKVHEFVINNVEKIVVLFDGYEFGIAVKFK